MNDRYCKTCETNHQLPHPCFQKEYKPDYNQVYNDMWADGGDIYSGTYSEE